MKKFGIDIDDAANGIGLGKEFHKHLHTQKYYDAVNEAAKNWGCKEDTVSGLRAIAEALKNAAGAAK